MNAFHNAAKSYKKSNPEGKCLVIAAAQTVILPEADS